MKTIDEIKLDFDKSGMSIAEWTRQHGYSYQSVQRSLMGSLKTKEASHMILLSHLV